MANTAERTVTLPRIRPRPMAFDAFFLFVYTLVALAFLAQIFLIVWPLLF